MDVLCLVREMVRVMTQPASVGASECMWSHHYYHQRHPVFSLFPGWGAPCSEIMCSPRGSLQPPSPSAERPQSTPPHACPFALHLGSHSWSLQPLGVQPLLLSSTHVLKGPLPPSPTTSPSKGHSLYLPREAPGKQFSKLVPGNPRSGVQVPARLLLPAGEFTMGFFLSPPSPHSPLSAPASQHRP